MKKIICLMVAALMLTFTACSSRENNRNDAPDGVVQDGDGMIDETGKDNVVNDAVDGAEDIVDGATDVVDDAANGVQNAVDDMTDSDKKDKNK